MTGRHSTWVVAAASALMVAACGGGSATDDPTTAGQEETATTAGGGEDTTATTAPPTGDGAAEVVATVDGVEYRLSVSDDVAVGDTGSFFPTRCEPNSFGAGIFWVVATAVDENGVRAEPNVNLVVNLPHEGHGSPDMQAEFELFVASSGDSPLQLSYVLANEEGLTGVGAPPYEGELGSWTVDGNRITGEVTVFEGDHLREFFTAGFDITCPAP